MSANNNHIVQLVNGQVMSASEFEKNVKDVLLVRRKVSDKHIYKTRIQCELLCKGINPENYPQCTRGNCNNRCNHAHKKNLKINSNLGNKIERKFHFLCDKCHSNQLNHSKKDAIQRRAKEEEARNIRMQKGFFLQKDLQAIASKMRGRGRPKKNERTMSMQQVLQDYPNFIQKVIQIHLYYYIHI